MEIDDVGGFTMPTTTLGAVGRLKTGSKTRYPDSAVGGNGNRPSIGDGSTLITGAGRLDLGFVGVNPAQASREDVVFQWDQDRDIAKLPSSVVGGDLKVDQSKGKSVGAQKVLLGHGESLPAAESSGNNL